MVTVLLKAANFVIWNQQDCKKLWQICDEAFENVVTLLQRQENVVKKNRHQCAFDNDFDVFHYYCPVYLWKKRT